MSEQGICHKEKDISPAERRRTKVRNSIICAAEKIFLREGEIAVSMRRLAEETDYSPAALYKYFGSKAEVYEAVREAFFEKLVIRISHAMKSGGSATQICQAAAKAYIATALENPGTYLMAYSSWSDHIKPEEGSYGYQAAAHLQNLIDHGVKSGEFHPGNAALAGKTIWSSLHGLASLLIQVEELQSGLVLEECHTQEEVIEYHIRFLTDALCANGK